MLKSIFRFQYSKNIFIVLKDSYASHKISITFFRIELLHLHLEFVSTLENEIHKVCSNSRTDSKMTYLNLVSKKGIKQGKEKHYQNHQTILWVRVFLKSVFCWMYWFWFKPLIWSFFWTSTVSATTSSTAVCKIVNYIKLLIVWTAGNQLLQTQILHRAL